MFEFIIMSLRFFYVTFKSGTIVFKLVSSETNYFQFNKLWTNKETNCEILKQLIFRFHKTNTQTLINNTCSTMPFCSVIKNEYVGKKVSHT